jgi:hypothetical protein
MKVQSQNPLFSKVVREEAQAEFTVQTVFDEAHGKLEIRADPTKADVFDVHFNEGFGGMERNYVLTVDGQPVPLKRAPPMGFPTADVEVPAGTTVTVERADLLPFEKVLPYVVASYDVDLEKVRVGDQPLGSFLAEHAGKSLSPDESLMLTSVLTKSGLDSFSVKRIMGSLEAGNLEPFSWE